MLKTREEVREFVNEKIHSKRVVFFSKTTCRFCSRAKENFRQYVKDGIITMADLESVDLDRRPDGELIQDYLETVTGSRTVPRVFIDGQFIGGGEEIMDLEIGGDLEKILKTGSSKAHSKHLRVQSDKSRHDMYGFQPAESQNPALDNFPGHQHNRQDDQNKGKQHGQRQQSVEYHQVGVQHYGERPTEYHHRDEEQQGHRQSSSHLNQETEKVQDLVERTIRSKKVVFFSHTNTLLTHNAKENFRQYVQDGTLKMSDLENIDLSRRRDGDQIHDYLKHRTGSAQLPSVFINGFYIGSGEQVKDLEVTGQLAKMLARS